jgi:hypothetical protein
MTLSMGFRSLVSLEAASGFKHHTLRRGAPHNLMSRAIPRASLLTLDVFSTRSEGEI